MRTKSLCLGAALLAAGLLASSAQSNVYSLNIVGYVNLSLTNGLNLVANPLDLDGTGTNNTIASVVGTNFPNLTKVYAFNSGSGSYVSATYSSSSATWLGGANVAAAMQPGAGFFIQIPASATLPQTLTLVGNVLVGTNSTQIAPAYQILGSKLPVGGGLVSALGYAPANLDKTYQWVPASQTYGSAHTYSAGTSTWLGGGEPTLNVGEGFWLLGHAGSAWTQVLTNTP